LTLDISFGHNLCFKYPNGSWEPILDIQVPRAFQWYKDLFNPMGFDPCNWSLKIWKSIGTPCRNPTLAKCEDETHSPKVGDLESSGTPECLEFDNKGQNTSPWGVLNVIWKVLKCKCPKWPRIGHLDICSPSYGQKKGRESNW
jgi:hypothetical protein